MDAFEKDEFWKALGRLYDTSANLVGALGELRKLSESHERRLDKLEVVQQWLAEKERDREKGNETQ